MAISLEQMTLFDIQCDNPRCKTKLSDYLSTKFDCPRTRREAVTLWRDWNGQVLVPEVRRQTPTANLPKWSQEVPSNETLYLCATHARPVCCECQSLSVVWVDEEGDYWCEWDAKRPSAPSLMRRL